ncbi:MAG: chain-length determining protein, partial [Sphingomonadales bacterium]
PTQRVVRALPQGRTDLWTPKAFLRMIARRWKLFAAIFGGLVALTVLVMLLLTPIYTGVTQIKIDPSERSPIDFQAVANGAPPDQALIDTEVALMRSRLGAQAVVRKLGLARSPEFADGKTGALAENAAIEHLLEKLDVARDGTTYVVNLSYKSRDARTAATVANAVAGQYLHNAVQYRVGTAAAQSKILDKRLTELGSQVSEADQRLAQYRATTGLVEGDGSGTITEQQIAPLSSQLATAESEAAAARAAAAAAAAQARSGGIGSVSGVLASDVVGALREKRADIVNEQAQILQRYGPRYPDAIRTGQQLAEIDRQIADESARIVSGLQANAQAAGARAGSLRGELARLRGEQAGNTRASATAASLKRQAEAKSSVYTQTSEAAQKISSRQQGAMPQASIIEPAVIPDRATFPNKPLMLAFGILLGLIAASATVAVLEASSVGFRTMQDIEQGLGLPHLASLPHVTPPRGTIGGTSDFHPWDEVVDRPMSSFAEGLRSLRTTLAQSRQVGTSQVIALSSSVPREGKTSTAASLARVMAMSGDRVVLVDCDLRRNALADMTPDTDIGLVEVLRGEAPIDRALVGDARVKGLSILPLAKSVFDPTDLFTDEAIRLLLDALRSRFDSIILDVPPILAVADARKLAMSADAVILLGCGV